MLELKARQIFMQLKAPISVFFKKFNSFAVLWKCNYHFWLVSFNTTYESTSRISSGFNSHLVHFISPSLPHTQKNSVQKKFLIFPEMEFSCSNIKKILIFSQKKAFLIFSEIELSDIKIKIIFIFSEMEPCTFLPKLKK